MCILNKMDIQNSNVTIQINARDITGKPIRVSECEVFLIHVFTNDVKRYLTFTKRDMLMTESVDELTIPKHQMEQLESGVVQYTYDYLPINHQCVFENEMKIEESECKHPHHHFHNNLYHSKPVVTSIYWRNIHCHHPQRPLNTVTLFDIERLQREIDSERISREKDIQDLQDLFKEGFDDNLNEEINRSVKEDEKINTSIDNIKESIEGITQDINTNQESNKTEINQNKVDIASEVARATAKETELQQTIEGEANRAKSQEEVIATSLQMEKERATANEQNISSRIDAINEKFETFQNLQNDSISSEIERAKSVEASLNDKINNVNSALANEVQRSSENDVKHTELVETEANRAKAVENKISTDLDTEIQRAKDAEKHILGEVHNVQGEVSNIATLKNDIDTINNWVNNHTNDVDALNTKVNGIVSDVDKAKADILSEIAKCDAENNKLSTDIQTLSDSVYNKSEVDTKVNDINTSIASLENWKNNHSDNTDELNVKVTKLIADTEKLSTGLSTETTNRINEDTKLITKVEVVDGKVNAEIERAKSNEELIKSEVAELKANASAKHSELSDSIAETNANLTLAIDTESNRSKEVEKELNDKINSINLPEINSNISTLNDSLNAEKSERETGDKINADKIEIINGDKETIGSIAHALEDAKHYTDDELAKLNYPTTDNFYTKSEVSVAIEYSLNSYFTKKEIKDNYFTKEEVIELIKSYLDVDAENKILNVNI